MTLNISVAVHNRDPQPSPDVHYVQNILHRKGLYDYAIDGIYGDKSRYGVVRFQAQAGLDKDGIVGPLTYRKLAASDPIRPPRTDAARMADLFYRLVTQGIDGTRPVYGFGAEVSMHDPSPDRIDCSEGTQWSVTQVDGETWIDGSANQYRACTHISVQEAIHTKGALLFSSSNGLASGVHHVAVSMGDGRTAEARSTAKGCGSWSATDGRFNLAGKIPVLRY